MTPRERNQLRRLERSIRALEASRNHSACSFANCLQWASEYAEPGYDSPEAGIVLGDWNDIKERCPEWPHKLEWLTVNDYPSRLAKLFERLGCAIEWSDEWSTCSDCGAIVRTSPDGMWWQPSYYLGDGELLCDGCYGGHDSPYFDRFDVAEAWYHFLCGYHGGQRSLAYRRLSRLTRSFKPGRSSSLTNMSDNAKAIYRRLVDRFESDPSSVKI